MTELIRREDAIRATYGFERWTGIDEAPVEFAHTVLAGVPSVDAVDLVRCRECKRWNTDGYRAGNGKCLYHDSVTINDDGGTVMLDAERALQEAREQDHVCEFCYYEEFDEDAYPCSRCVCNRPIESKFKPKEKSDD